MGREMDVHQTDCKPSLAVIGNAVLSLDSEATLLQFSCYKGHCSSQLVLPLWHSYC